MNISDLVTYVADQDGKITKTQAKTLVDSVFAAITSAAVKGEASNTAEGGSQAPLAKVPRVKSDLEQSIGRYWYLWTGVVLLVVGLVMAVNVPILGLLVAAVAGGYLYHQKPMYHVMLATAGGEVSALKTRERAYLDKIVAAMNEAIVARG